MKRWGTLLLLLPSLAWAWQPSADAACQGTGTAPAQAMDFIALLRESPEQALAAACQRWRAVTNPANSATPATPANSTARRDAALDIAWASVAQEDKPPPTALLAGLEQDASLNPAERGRLHLIQGEAAVNRQDWGPAARLLAQAQEELPATGGLRQVRLWLASGYAGWALRRPDDLPRAEQWAAQAQAELERLGLAESSWMGDVLNLRSIVAHAREDYEACLRYAMAEVELGQRLGQGDKPEYLHSWITIAGVNDQLGRQEQADQAFAQGLALAERNAHSAGAHALAGFYANYATRLQARGRNTEARKAAEQALTLATQAWGPDSLHQLTPLTALAEVALAAFDPAAALRHADAGLALGRRQAASTPPWKLLRLLHARAQALQALGQWEEAGAAVDEGQALGAASDGGQAYWRARLLVLRAGLQALPTELGGPGTLAEADATLAEAEPLLRKVLKDGDFVTALVAQRCELQLRSRRAPEACQRLREQWQRAPHRLAEAAPAIRFSILAALGRQALAESDSAAALALDLQALAAASSRDSPYPLWLAFANLSQSLRAEGRRELAVLAGKQALALVEAARHHLAAESQRLVRGFLHDKRRAYSRLADWLSEDGRIDEALAVLRLLEEDEFHDFVRGARELAPQGGAQRLFSPAELDLLKWFSPAAMATATHESAPASKLSEAERAAQAEHFRSLAAQEAQRVGQWQSLLKQPLALQALRPRLPVHLPVRIRPPKGTLEAWVFAEDTHLSLVITDDQGRRSSRREAVGLDAVDRQDPTLLTRSVGQLLSRIREPELARAPLRLLQRHVGAPLLQAQRQARAKRLVLHVTGALRYLPFAALGDGRELLGERMAMAQQFDAAGPLPAAVAVDARASVKLLGVSRAMAGQPALPGLAREACAIVDGPVLGLDEADARCVAPGALSGEAWLNERFTVDALRQPAAQRLLHLGTHFVLRPGDMGRSWLLLGDGGRLSLDALAQMSFQGRELVTLSACDTGLGGARGRDGAEVEGLNLLVLRRGARAVLASLWRVDDTSTAALMGALYRHLAQGLAPEEALRLAQAGLRVDPRWRAPYHWAGFYLSLRP